MFCVVEFGSESVSEGLGVVRGDWLTPRKRETFWPPFKHSGQYNKALQENHAPDENSWKLCPIRKLFYSTDDIIKARQKLKDAEEESDLMTDDAGCTGGKRKRSKNKRFIDSTSEEENDSDYERKRRLPVPPVGQAKDLRSCYSEPVEIGLIQDNLLATGCPSPCSSVSIPHPTESWQQSCSSGTVPLVEAELRSQQQCNSPRAIVLSEPSRTNRKEGGFEVIAKRLARLEKSINDIKFQLSEVFKLLSQGAEKSSAHDSIDITLLCTTKNDVDKIEEWIAESNNAKLLEQKLSLVGGKKVANVTRRILETIFTNELASQYNWTGKFDKPAFRDLKLVQVISGAVRRNKYTTLATDAEIRDAISNWLRFSKDRDGGREKRRL